MRLICPRCSAEYEIEERLIPAGGREVQCSSCDNVWFQLGRLRMEAPKVATPPVQMDEPPAEPAPETVPPLVPRGLPEDVMDILRDEAAHFRASRPGLTGEETAGEAEAPPPANDANPPAPAAGAAPGEAPLPAPGTAAQAGEETAPAAAPEPAPAPEPAYHRSEFAEPEEERGGGFALGFLIGLIIAAGFYAIYRFAPDAGEGVLGDTLRGIRAAGISAHHWVQAQFAAFR